MPPLKGEVPSEGGWRGQRAIASPERGGGLSEAKTGGVKGPVNRVLIYWLLDPQSAFGWQPPFRGALQRTCPGTVWKQIVCAGI